MNIDKETLKDRIRGSLVAGAIGDAWGYPVEFMSHETITSHYGECGIASLDIDDVIGKAVISDDTQMTLFTAIGLLNASQEQHDYIDSILRAYIEWYYTQMWSPSLSQSQCFIADMPEFRVCRAPGNTCLSALYAITQGQVVLNHSKGCGGVMRIAPIPLYALAHPDKFDDLTVARLAGDVAMLTHKHPLGYIPAAFLAHLIYNLVSAGVAMRSQFDLYVCKAFCAVKTLYPESLKEIAQFREMVGRAIDLTNTDLSDNEAIDTIGEGWVGDEAVAIAIYCVCKYFDNFKAAIIAAVNHDGDSDSTGAITGQIMGAIMGYDAIPNSCKEDLEMHLLIVDIADMLYEGRLKEC